MTLKELMTRARLAAGFGELEYATAACEEALRHFPHHVEAHCLLGQALLERGRPSQAADHFEAALAADPENVTARTGLAVALERQGQLRRAIAELELAFEIAPGRAEVREALLSLRSQLERRPPSIEIGPAAEGRVRLRRGEPGLALAALDKALAAGPQRLDLRLARLEALWRAGRRDDAEATCRHLIEEMPLALKPKLLLALLLLERGEHAKGAELLHQASLMDPSHSVARRLFQETGLTLPDYGAHIGVSGPQVGLSPGVEAASKAPFEVEREGEAADDLPILESVSFAEPGTPSSDLAPIAAEISRHLSGHRVPTSQAAASRGSYLILTSAKRLEAKYGPRGFAAVQRKLAGLCSALEEGGFAAQLLLVDDAGLRAQGLEPLRSITPEAIKMLLDRLEVRLAERGRRPSHILIVGGDDIIPFHHLANPTDDDDRAVASDVPLQASGEALFQPVRSVGRIPDAASPSPALLLALLDGIIARCQEPPSPGGSRPWPWNRFLSRSGLRGEFGYTALVWRTTTEAIYSEIGDPKTLRASPPTTARSFEMAWLDGRRFHLFNLHGTEASRYWYGQKDASYPADYPLFPVALSPDLLAQADLTGAIVFTEACYGANILAKREGDSIALELLRRGAACVVGSTGAAYGSGTPPLCGADLLAQLFWQELRNGATAGEALVRAKAAFVRSIHDRQGYLDGDDQKTVLSFILLGDPAARLVGIVSKEAAMAGRAILHQESVMAAPALYCHHRSLLSPCPPLSGELLLGVRRHLLRVAPETADAQLTVQHRMLCHRADLGRCEAGCALDTEEKRQADAYMITSKKALPTPDGAPLLRVARVTMDERGGILKVSVSK